MSEQQQQEDPTPVLSDLEEEEEEHKNTTTHPPTTTILDTDISVSKFQELVTELDNERKARQAVDISYNELQGRFNRLKIIAHEAIKKRDEASRSNDDVSKQLAQTVNENDGLSRKLSEMVVERDGLSKRLNEAVNEKDGLSRKLTEMVNEKDGLSRKLNETVNEKDGLSRKLSETVNEKDGLSRKLSEVVNEKRQLAEAVNEKDGYMRQLTETVKEKDGLLKRIEELVKEKDSSRTEVETAAKMLVTGIEKVSGKVSGYKDFIGGGLPRSQKYTGLPAVAYGVIKRSNEIVEELVKQIESATMSANEARGQVEERNYEIAIEVSELESRVSELREDVVKKDIVIDGFEKTVAEKDGRLMEYDVKLKNLTLQIDSQRPLLVDQLNYVSKVLEQLCSVIKILEDDDDDGDKKDESIVSDSMFLPQETDFEENIRAVLAGLESISELSSTVQLKTKDLVSEKNQEVKKLNESVTQLMKEKEYVGSLLKSALSRRMSADLSSKTNELFRVAENGLKEAGIDYQFSNHTNDRTASASVSTSDTDNKDDEIYTLAGALENIIKQSQLEIIELKHTVDELREETRLLKDNAEAQAKEHMKKIEQLEKLKEKERVANENVEGLMMDIASAEEEITRWKAAAQQEAEAGRAIEQEYMAQLSTVRQELEEAKQGVIESEKKLKFKEQTAAAAMAARDAAEKSLRLADSRASRLRERVEELTSQLEKLDTHESQSGQSRPRYVCWPWQWLGLNYVGSQTHTPGLQPHSSNEMELSEPLI